MNLRLPLVAACLLTLAGLGCESAPGRPKAEPEVPRPDQIHDFAVLYKENCAACHGENGKGGAATSLANPVYLALAGESTLLQATSKGVPGTLMPPFAKSAGGMLTDQQIHDLVDGMMKHWAQPSTFAGQNLPSYASTEKGDVQRGQKAFAASCASCHGADGEGLAAKDAQAKHTYGSIVDPSYLALVSDQSLRTTIISGVPAEGMPDWRGDVPTHALTDQEITDIVAWLASHRTPFPGQPYPTQRTLRQQPQ